MSTQIKIEYSLGETYVVLDEQQVISLAKRFYVPEKIDVIPHFDSKEGIRGVCIWERGNPDNDFRIVYRYASPIEKEVVVSEENVRSIVLSCIERSLEKCDSPQLLRHGFADRRENIVYKIELSHIKKLPNDIWKKLESYNKSNFKKSFEESHRLISAICPDVLPEFEKSNSELTNKGD